VVAEENLKIPVVRLGTDDKFVHRAGTRDYLLSQHGISVEQIKERIRKKLR